MDDRKLVKSGRAWNIELNYEFSAKLNPAVYLIDN